MSRMNCADAETDAAASRESTKRNRTTRFIGFAVYAACVFGVQARRRKYSASGMNSPASLPRAQRARQTSRGFSPQDARRPDVRGVLPQDGSAAFDAAPIGERRAERYARTTSAVDGAFARASRGHLSRGVAPPAGRPKIIGARVAWIFFAVFKVPRFTASPASAGAERLLGRRARRGWLLP